MIYLGVIVGLGLIGGMIYLALNKKSNTAVRIAAIIALGIMILTVIICLIIILTDNKVAVDESVLIVGAPVETGEVKTSNIVVLLVLILILLALFGVIAYLTIKENRRQKLAINDGIFSKPISKW